MPMFGAIFLIGGLKRIGRAELRKKWGGRMKRQNPDMLKHADQRDRTNPLPPAMASAHAHKPIWAQRCFLHNDDKATVSAFSVISGKN
jgi:hypothetical protein